MYVGKYSLHAAFWHIDYEMQDFLKWNYGNKRSWAVNQAVKNYGPHNWFPNARKPSILKSDCNKGVALEDLEISLFNGRVVCTKSGGKDGGTSFSIYSQRCHSLFKTYLFCKPTSRRHIVREETAGRPADPVHNWQTIAACFFPSRTHSWERERYDEIFRECTITTCS